MINLISPEQKRDIRAARSNVTLVQSALALVSLGILIGLIYGIGFWIVGKEKSSVDEVLSSQSNQASAFTRVEKEADSFRSNLQIAKTILGKETSYSDFLMTLASDLPSGAVITNISLGGGASTPAAAKEGMKLDARTNSYAKVLELKSKLEASSLFENVSIASATRPDNITTLSGLEARYPYEVTYSVKLSKKTTAGVSR